MFNFLPVVKITEHPIAFTFTTKVNFNLNFEYYDGSTTMIRLNSKTERMIFVPRMEIFWGGKKERNEGKKEI